ncbi:MFS transporter [Embleya hyalina]|uniref:Putative actinorhodin transporter n=1 Tax=Embleya hyalina TaxID=516124 RepID=A0A401YQD6_9ACTN|nr:MFS transporter [Embleya hyalina]GCD96812.1 putative actinorhodin transporter [Embleya hyalina]
MKATEPRPVPHPRGVSSEAPERIADAVPPPGGRGRIVAVGVVMAAVVMDMLDASVVNVALPTLRADLHAGSAMLQWLLAGYTLAFAVLLTAGGRLGDVLGYRRVFLVGTGVFTVLSVACALAPNAELLVAARIGQGAAAALMVPQATALLQIMYAPHERARVMGLLSPIAGLSAALGPLVGGAILHADLFGTGWRPIFLMNLPVGVAVLVAAYRLLPSGRSAGAPRFDPRGTVYAVVGFGLLVLPLVQGPALHWPAWTVVCLVVSPIPLTLFVRDQRVRAGRGEATLVEPSLFRRRSFAGGLAVSLVVEAVLGGLMLVATFALQDGLGLSALAAGLATLPMIVGMVVGAAVLADPLIPRVGRHVVTIGGATVAAGTLALLWPFRHYGADCPVWAPMPGLFVAGVGLGMLMGPLFAITLQDVDTAHAGTASGTLEAVEQLGGALGVVTIGAVFLHHTTAGDSLGTAFGWGAGAILIVLALALALVPLLPRRFRTEDELGPE